MSATKTPNMILMTPYGRRLGNDDAVQERVKMDPMATTQPRRTRMHLSWLRYAFYLSAKPTLALTERITNPPRAVTDSE